MNSKWLRLPNKSYVATLKVGFDLNLDLSFKVGYLEKCD